MISLHRRLTPLALAVLACAHGAAHAADDAFTLGTVTVTGQRPQVGDMPQDQVGSVVTRQDMQQFDRQTVADAVNLLPGVTLSTNSRNESLVYVRGFDARHVPLFIDGVPVYVPYDGYVDFGRFITQDLAAIQVAKGFSSIAYGPNALGGAINLVSRKPTKAFEGDAFMGLGAGSSREAGINLGARQEVWYAQLGLSHREADGFRLSSDFVPTATEDGGQRNNADRRDSKLSFKLGLTPNTTDEYALSYHRQDGTKGQPPSTDPTNARYWRWPYWDKESLYFVSKTALGNTETVKLRLYSDRFDNEVNSFTDPSYTSLRTSGRGSVSTGRSIYNDRSTGGGIELESSRFAGHVLRAVVQQKMDRHEEVDGGALVNTRYKDTVRSFGVEDLMDIAKDWQLSVGAARHSLRPDSVFNVGPIAYGLPDKSTAANWQTGLFHDLNLTNRLYATLARKTRLPTLKDRYSQRLGNYIENPNLGPERSSNLEFGYQGQPLAAMPSMKVEAAVFQSRIDDKIQPVFVSGGASCGPATPCQMRNVGQARVRGLEMGARGTVLPWLDLGGNLTVLSQKNLSMSDVRLVGVPDRKLFAYAVARPAAGVSLQASVEQNSKRWVSDTAALSGFSTLGLKASWSPMAALTLEAGIDNVTDRNFQLDDGFPAAGRSWFANLRYVF